MKLFQFYSFVVLWTPSLVNSFSPLLSAPQSITMTNMPALHMSSNSDIDEESKNHQFSRRRMVSSVLVSATTAASALALGGTLPAQARLEAVNRPELLPAEKGLNVIQTEKFLTSGQARRMNELLVNLERDTGFRLKVLCQNYPNTPGLAIRDYWSLGKEAS
jgi:hypothetical protein